MHCSSECACVCGCVLTQISVFECPVFSTTDNTHRLQDQIFRKVWTDSSNIKYLTKNVTTNAKSSYRPTLHKVSVLVQGISWLKLATYRKYVTRKPWYLPSFDFWPFSAGYYFPIVNWSISLQYNYLSHCALSGVAHTHTHVIMQKYKTQIQNLDKTGA